jgi:hypothetical protein
VGGQRVAEVDGKFGFMSHHFPSIPRPNREARMIDHVRRALEESADRDMCRETRRVSRAPEAMLSALFALARISMI